MYSERDGTDREGGGGAIGNGLAPRGTIALGVTSEQSLKLMSGLPERLAAWGWDVHVVVSRASAGMGPGVTCHEVPMRREPALVQDLVALIRWVRLLASVRPDVVMAGTPKAGMLGTLAALIVRVPVRIYLLRGLRCASERGLRRRALAGFEVLTAAASTKVLAVSPSLRREYVKLGLASQEKIVVLGPGSSNGVDIRRSSPVHLSGGERIRRDLNLPNGAFVVGYVGRVAKDKDVVVLLHAIRRLNEAGVSAMALIVGPEEPAGILSRCMATSGVDRNSVIWTGEVASVDRYYEAMDVLCLPTRREGFPNVVLEAAIHAIPAVATRVTGCVDAVIDGQTGILVAPGDPEHLADALARLANDGNARKSMGEKARKRAINDFSQEHVWARISNFLDAQIKTHDGTRLK